MRTSLPFDVPWRYFGNPGNMVSLKSEVGIFWRSCLWNTWMAAFPDGL
jgi:hypothetical protein